MPAKLSQFNCAFLNFQGYIACALGVHNVGFVLITYGVLDAICSISFGALIKFTGRVPIFILGAALNLITIIVFFEWHPDPEKPHVFFILAGMWGISDAVWQTQINGEISLNFNTC